MWLTTNKDRLPICAVILFYCKYRFVNSDCYSLTVTSYTQEKSVRLYSQDERHVDIVSGGVSLSGRSFNFSRTTVLAWLFSFVNRRQHVVYQLANCWQFYFVYRYWRWRISFLIERHLTLSEPVKGALIFRVAFSSEFGVRLLFMYLRTNQRVDFQNETWSKKSVSGERSSLVGSCGSSWGTLIGEILFHSAFVRSLIRNSFTSSLAKSSARSLILRWKAANSA